MTALAEGLRSQGASYFEAKQFEAQNKTQPQRRGDALPFEISSELTAMPDLFTRLQQTVDDPKLFDLRYIDNKAAAKTQFREIFADLQTAAHLAWRGNIEDEDDPAYGQEAQRRGVYFKDPNGHVLELLTRA